MKCPKCQYISFDRAERCRNCGFEFALAAPSPGTPDLALRAEGASEGPPQDFTLRRSTPSAAPAAAGRGAGRGARAHTPGVDLPLFEAPVAGVDDTPLIKAPATPRPPLAVRRQAPDSGRRLPPSEPVREPDPFEVFTSDDGLEPGLLPELEPAVPARSARPARPPAPRAITLEPAPVGRRVWAAIVDGAILAGIDAVVLYLTLQLTGLPAREMLRLPLLPLLGFLALVNGGYLVSFTVAQGQTIGKALAGIRVVSASGNRVPLASAVVRAAAATVSVLPLGIGCLPVLAGGDRLTLHDRLSATRVVRA